MKKLLYTLASCSLLLVGCENEIAFRGEQTAQQMVLNTLISASTPISAKLTNSVFFLSNDEIKDIADADMRLIVNGVEVEQMQYKEVLFTDPDVDNPDEVPQVNRMEPQYHDGPYYSYQAAYVPKEGDKVRIEATSPKFEGKVWAETTVPLKPAINKIDYKINQRRLTNKTTVTMHIRFADLPEENNCYMLAVRAKLSFPFDGNIYHCYLMPNYSDAVFAEETTSIFNMDNFDSYSATPMFDDKLFDGNDDYPLTVMFSPEKTAESQEGFDLTNGTFAYTVYFRQISRAYYNYLKTMSKYTSDNLFTEPVQVYNNVNGGFGIMGAESLEKVEYDKPVSWD